MTKRKISEILSKNTGLAASRFKVNSILSDYCIKSNDIIDITYNKATTTFTFHLKKYIFNSLASLTLSTFNITCYYYNFKNDNK